MQQVPLGWQGAAVQVAPAMNWPVDAGQFALVVLRQAPVWISQQAPGGEQMPAAEQVTLAYQFPVQADCVVWAHPPVVGRQHAPTCVHGGGEQDVSPGYQALGAGHWVCGPTKQAPVCGLQQTPLVVPFGHGVVEQVPPAYVP
jgi:hypothetical protein